MAFDELHSRARRDSLDTLPCKACFQRRLLFNDVWLNMTAYRRSISKELDSERWRNSTD